MNYSFLQKMKNKKSGITLIEAIIAVGLFVGIAVGLFSTFMRITAVMRLSQAKVVAVALANEQFEIARNLPYSRIGTAGGVPAGLLTPVQTFVRGGLTFVATTTVRNIDQSFDGTAGGVPNDLSPADNKLVEIEITCISCASYRPVILSTTIGPRDLESASTNGSLFVRTFNAGGQPVSGANVRIVNNAVVPAININDVSNTGGMLQLIDAPPSFQSYEVTVSKAGYSSDRTRSTPATPLTPHATVAVQAVTQLTFFIDLLAILNVTSVTPTCAVVPNVGVELVGSKLIATGPDVPKYKNWFTTGASGAITRTDIEWDPSYTLTASSATHDLAGVSTLSPFSVAPGITKNIQAIMVPKGSPAVMVTARDAGTLGPLSGATVTMDDGVNPPIVRTTGRGFLRQTDWSGGNMQDEFVDPTKYKDNSSTIDSSGAGDVRLLNVFGNYADGWLESSIFDTGSASTFYQFTYQPVAQQPAVGGAPILFQLSTGLATTSMGPYLGYDGTASTFYSSTSTDISATHLNDRYLKYKMYLTTSSTTLTPVVSDILFSFTSSCIPPGQVIFQNLPFGNYALTVSKPLYGNLVINNIIVNAGTSWQEVSAPLVLN